MSLTSGRNTIEVANGARIIWIPVAANTRIFEGCLVVVDATGYAKPATKDENLTAVGRAETFADNTGGAVGDKFVTVKRGVFIWDNDTATNALTTADVMKPCYIKDDCTVTRLSEGSSQAGKVIQVFDNGMVAVETI